MQAAVGPQYGSIAFYRGQTNKAEITFTLHASYILLNPVVFMLHGA